MRTCAQFILLTLVLTLAASCAATRDAGFGPPPVVILWDKPPLKLNPGDDPAPPVLTLFPYDGEPHELDFAPQWSSDVFISTGSGVAAFVGGDDALSLNEKLQCRDIATGKELFSIEGSWQPLGFIEEGWVLVALKIDSGWGRIRENDPAKAFGGFTTRGYKLKYTLHLLNVLTGESEKEIEIYDVQSKLIRWEDRREFKPQLAPGAGLLFAALPRMPYKTDEIADEVRPAKLWALNLRTGECEEIGLRDYVRNRNFSYIVSSDGGSIVFQTQKRADTVALKMAAYGDTRREWGDMFLYNSGGITPVTGLDDNRVRQQMGISRRGKEILYAEIDYDPESERPVEGTLGFVLAGSSGKNVRELPLKGDVLNVSLSPGGRWLSYMISTRGRIEARLLDTLLGDDRLIAECGPYTRFYGFAGAGRGDIAIPALDAMLFGFKPSAGESSGTS
jgi:hypothetical protein